MHPLTRRRIRQTWRAVPLAALIMVAGLIAAFRIGWIWP